MVGVFAKSWIVPLAEVLKELGSERAFVVHGSDGLDEITISGTTDVAALEDGRIRTFEIAPEDVGLARAPAEALKGGDAAHNAEALGAVLDGAPGAYRDVALFNAAAALFVAGRARDLKEGVALAGASLDTGAARDRLLKLVAVSAALAPEGGR
jgi:anthranilate phosphoribosyltransferase